MANAIDPDMFTAPFQLTKSMHRDVYDAVDPTNTALSATGKVVLVTGAGGGLGFKIACTWSLAGAEGVVLVGRNEQKLQETSNMLKGSKLVVSGDISDTSSVESVFAQAMKKYGRVDVVINSAGVANMGVTTGDANPSQWWFDFEVNVKGTYLLAHQFIKTMGGKGTFINLITLGASFLAPGVSSYSSSQLAATKLGEYLDLENPDLRVFSVHPGIVEPEEGRGAVVGDFTPFAKDKQALTAGVTLYLQKPEADFLRGGFYSVNWDVMEMEQHKHEITEKKLLKLAFLNGKLAPGGYTWSE